MKKIIAKRDMEINQNIFTIKTEHQELVYIIEHTSSAYRMRQNVTDFETESRIW